MAGEDLWGDLPVIENIETPLSILRAQATLLEEKTNGYLTGRVTSSTNYNGDIEHELSIVAPTLGNYSTTVATVTHGALLYPAFVQGDSRGALTSFGPAEYGEQLKAMLAQVLGSPSVHKTIVALLAQTRDESV